MRYVTGRFIPGVIIRGQESICLSLCFGDRREDLKSKYDRN